MDYLTEVYKDPCLQTSKLLPLYGTLVRSVKRHFLRAKVTCTYASDVVNSVVILVTAVRVRWSGIQFPVGAGDFSLLQDDHTGSGVSLG
jgi:hypothetical protein